MTALDDLVAFDQKADRDAPTDTQADWRNIMLG